MWKLKYKLHTNYQNEIKIEFELSNENQNIKYILSINLKKVQLEWLKRNTHEN